MQVVLNIIYIVLEIVATVLGIVSLLIGIKNSKEIKRIYVKTKGNNNSIQVGNNNAINKR